MTSVYVLKLENEKYYVGKTEKKVQDRFLEHMNDGVAWTRLYKPIGIISYFTSLNRWDEDNTVKDCMMKYGIDNVRGGSYSQIVLTQDQIDALNREIRGALDLCGRLLK